MARKISFRFCAFLRFRSRLISSIVSNLTVGIIKLSLIRSVSSSSLPFGIDRPALLSHSA